jgi:isopenicillin-N epimerase
VIKAREKIGREIAPAPDLWYASSFRNGRDAWNDIAQKTAVRFGAQPQDVALVFNATDGVNAVLRSLTYTDESTPLTFKAGDEILVSSHVYGALRLAAERILKPLGVSVKTYPLTFPQPSADECVESLKKTITSKTKLVMIDHVTSCNALVLPAKEMTKVCRDRGVLALVDGAQAPGNIPLNITDIGADFYTGNIHKWYFLPQACGFLWVSPERQKNLAPTILSWECNKPFPASFEWPGTADQTVWLSVPAAYEFMDRFGEKNVIKHNHALVREGLRILEDAWNFKSRTPDSMIGSAAIAPLPESMPYPHTDDARGQIQNDLWYQHKIMASVSHLAEGRIWLRFCAQIYNEPSDYERLARAVLKMSGKACSGPTL